MKHTISIALIAVLTCLSVASCNKNTTISVAPSYQIKMDKDSVFVGDTVVFYADVLNRGAYYGNGTFDWKVSGVETTSSTIKITDPYGAEPKQINYKFVVKKTGKHTVSMSATVQFYAPSESGALFAAVTAKGLSFVACQRSN